MLLEGLLTRLTWSWVTPRTIQLRLIESAEEVYGKICGILLINERHLSAHASTNSSAVTSQIPHASAVQEIERVLVSSLDMEAGESAAQVRLLCRES